MQYRKLTTKQHENLLRDFKKGFSRKGLCKKYKICWQTLYNYSYKKPKQYNNVKDFNVVHTYFEKIDSEQKAYWLGFLFADGNLSSTQTQLRVGCAIKDEKHVRKFFKEQLKSIAKEYLYAPTKVKHFHVDSVKLHKDLIKLGMVPTKTFILKFPKIPKYLIRHFIRGYFDGDGCVTASQTQPKVQFIGTEDILKNIMLNLKIQQTIHPISKISKMTCIWIGARSNVEKIYTYLYTDSTIYLKRKKKKFEVLLGLSKKQIS